MNPNILTPESSSEEENARHVALTKQDSQRYLSKSIAHLLYPSSPAEVTHPSHLSREDRQKLEQRHEHLWELMSSYLSTEISDIEQIIVLHIEYTLARSRFTFDERSAYLATAYSLRDRLIEYWNDTQQFFTDKQVKRVYYMSIEYLMGRSLQNALLNLGLKDNYSKALREIGVALEDLYDEEVDAGLGNGGLGRLAACFMDSLATLNYPAWGYGIRYEFGMFKQDIHEGCQAETPDFWLRDGNPWEIPRRDVRYPIRFYGTSIMVTDTQGNVKVRWEGGEVVMAVAYDTPIPGFETLNTLNIRLWSSEPSSEFDLASFNDGDYESALRSKQRAQDITSVLYPSDKTEQGKILRLKQQYFFACATLQDIVRRFKKQSKPFTDFPDYVAIQLNDTHPTISVPELMRMLIDNENLPWDDAWEITVHTFAYTNHTILPEALEKWPVPIIETLLPRHMQIIYEINWRFLQTVREMLKVDDVRALNEKLSSMSVIEESNPKMVRMANLAIISSHRVNGVSKVHTEIVKHEVFAHFYELWPYKFINITNGVTPRRWLVSANPQLAALITETLKTNEWMTNLTLLQGLLDHLDDETLLYKVSDIKFVNKQQLASVILEHTGIEVNANALFDIQVKRIHEYKRQFLNILGYRCILEMTAEQRSQVVPRVVIIAGKAAPAYMKAKLIIRLIHAVASVVNNDKQVGDLLKVVFLPNYGVSMAETIVPASDISQHISTAGTEASGTSNMKFAMNGGLILGTYDGANIEILEEIGADNMFAFGAKASEVHSIRSGSKTSIVDERLFLVLKMIDNEVFGANLYSDLLAPLYSGNDYYLVAYDFPAYIAMQDEIDKCYKSSLKWAKKCLASIAKMGKFSSDNAIDTYAEQVWDVEPEKLRTFASSSIMHVRSSMDIQHMSSLRKLATKERSRSPSSTPIPHVDAASNGRSARFSKMQRNKGTTPDGEPTN